MTTSDARSWAECVFLSIVIICLTTAFCYVMYKSYEMQRFKLEHPQPKPTPEATHG